MRGAGDQFSIGERVAFYRRRRGLTQRVLAGLVGRSEDWVSKIERDEREVRRLDVIGDLARALRVSVGDLLGQPVLVEDEKPTNDDVPAIRDALMSHRRLSRTLFQTVVAQQLPAEPVRRRAEMAWDDFQNGRLGAVIAALPALITSSQALEDAGDDTDPGTDVWAVSARVHHLAASTLAKIGEADLAWMAAERAMSAADRSENPLVLASAARAGAGALMAVGRYDDAMNLGVTAASWLHEQAEDGDPAALSLEGMLYLRTAVAAARRQDRGSTTDLLRQADRAATRLGRDSNYWQTGFGPTNVRLHEVSAGLELGDVLLTVERGQDVDASHMPTERATAHRIDMGRAFSYVARDDEALVQLLEAEQMAPQLVRHSVAVRETVRSLHRRAPATASKGSPLLGLAERCRAVQ